MTVLPIKSKSVALSAGYPNLSIFANRQTLPDLAAYLPSVVSYKFAYKVRIALSVMPVETGIQTTLKYWTPGRAAITSLPGMTTEFCCEFLTQNTSVLSLKFADKIG